MLLDNCTVVLYKHATKTMTCVESIDHMQQARVDTGAAFSKSVDFQYRHNIEF